MKKLNIVFFTLFLSNVLFAGTSDTIFIKDIPVISEAETVLVVETVVETLQVVTGTTEQIAQPQPTKAIQLYTVQAGAFNIKENADNFLSTLKPIYGDEVYMEHIPPYWKVRIGRYNTWKASIPMREELLNKGYSDAWIVR